jgi:hypothetical protein
MPEVNFEWVRQQLQEAKAKVGAGNAVLELLKVWSEQTKLSEKSAQEAIQMFSKLALGTVLVQPEVASNEVWIPALPGQLVVGDEVRVLANAFSDSVGVSHNGRRGRVVAIRYGDVIFKSTDGKEPVLEGTHYSPYKLETRIK